MQQVLKTLAVDDTDVLQTAGSALRRAPYAGKYRIWYGSDQADGLVDVRVAGLQVVEPSTMPVITIGQLKLEGPPQLEFTVDKGDDIIINYNEVTAGTATMLIKALSLVDILLEAGYSPTRIASELQRMG